MNLRSLEAPARPARKHILGVEMLGFGAVLASVWLTELLDPPFSFSQVLIETATIVAVAVVVLAMTRRLLQRIKTLEGFLTMCASCKKLRIDGQWVPLETFLAHRSDLLLSHGVCNDCGHKLYPEDWVEGR